MSESFGTDTNLQRILAIFHPKNGVLAVLRQINTRIIQAVDIYIGDDVDYDLYNNFKQPRVAYNKSIKLNLIIGK